MELPFWFCWVVLVFSRMVFMHSVRQFLKFFLISFLDSTARTLQRKANIVIASTRRLNIWQMKLKWNHRMLWSTDEQLVTWVSKGKYCRKHQNYTNGDWTAGREWHSRNNQHRSVDSINGVTHGWITAQKWWGGLGNSQSHGNTSSVSRNLLKNSQSYRPIWSNTGNRVTLWVQFFFLLDAGSCLSFQNQFECVFSRFTVFFFYHHLFGTIFFKDQGYRAKLLLFKNWKKVADLRSFGYFPWYFPKLSCRTSVARERSQIVVVEN